MSTYSYAGLVMIAVGLIEIYFTPALLQRLWGPGPLPHREYLMRSLRTSGLFVIALGLAFLLRLFG